MGFDLSAIQSCILLFFISFFCFYQQMSIEFNTPLRRNAEDIPTSHRISGSIIFWLTTMWKYSTPPRWWSCALCFRQPSLAVWSHGHKYTFKSEYTYFHDDRKNSSLIVENRHLDYVGFCFTKQNNRILNDI